jgi:N-acetylglucosamine-6-phosphate deacetylase
VNGSLVVRGAGRLDDPSPIDVVVQNGRIGAIGRDLASTASAETPVVDADGLALAPGLIDLQVNGALGDDLTADPASLWRVAAALPRWGATAFLPTIVSSPAATTDDALTVFRAGPPEGWRGAVPLGWHFEGPFLSPERHGAHDPAALRPPDPALVVAWSRDAGLRIVTLAPELPGALDLAAQLTARGIVVSAGHSAASLDEGRAGIEAGIRYATHLFNAMPPLDKRSPGLVAALLADPRVVVGLIPDGFHVDPAIVDLVARIVGPDRLSIVSDAVSALGRPSGLNRLGAMDVVTDGVTARLLDGTLCGSVLAMDDAVRRLAAFSGWPAPTALGSMTDVPARLLGETDRGVVRPGARADLVLLDDAFRVGVTIVGGEVLHLRDPARLTGAEVPVTT